ncbi:hypothetical protein ACSBR2_017226 [Camellia fascicularis]
MVVEEDTLDTQLHMTRMPNFLGLATAYGLCPHAGYGDSIIIGFVDTGIWLENVGFRDEGLLPLNGSKCCSGAEISSVGMLGFTYGDAQGIAPKARIAVYKACWRKICTLTDTLAAIDVTIFDGVDILSISMGKSSPKPFYNDVYMISMLKAAQNDIFVTFGVGNMGLTPSTVFNSAPWVTTIGSSTIDRTYPAKVQLENGEQVPNNSLCCGKSVTDDAFSLQFYSTCIYDNIPSDSIKGKILICNASDIAADAIAFTITEAQGVGYIQLNVKGDEDLNLGLIFDIDGVEYIDFLCTLNYSASQLYKIVEEQVFCEEPAFHLVSWLNYLSFLTVFNKQRRGTRLWRTVTHVAELTETCTLIVVDSNPNIMISIVLKQLQFTRAGEKKSYSIEMSFFYSDGPNRLDLHVSMDVLAVGYVIWESCYYYVRVLFTVLWSFE